MLRAAARAAGWSRAGWRDTADRWGPARHLRLQSLADRDFGRASTAELRRMRRAHPGGDQRLGRPGAGAGAQDGAELQAPLSLGMPGDFAGCDAAVVLFLQAAWRRCVQRRQRHAHPHAAPADRGADGLAAAAAAAATAAVDHRPPGNTTAGAAIVLGDVPRAELGDSTTEANSLRDEGCAGRGGREEDDGQEATPEAQREGEFLTRDLVDDAHLVAARRPLALDAPGAPRTTGIAPGRAARCLRRRPRPASGTATAAPGLPSAAVASRIISRPPSQRLQDRRCWRRGRCRRALAAGGCSSSLLTGPAGASARRSS
ncbi:unnamed protein product [Prorocentrum cordatum]|uniref:Uncharacterized protein n=1 Tax=Prorocentrum cordatum TaxID=2364126 RepID=A0ABN9PM20_9DINO|nr:unnamed protein product [Polarella glacialis]